MSKIFKKLAVFLTIFLSTIEACKENYTPSAIENNLFFSFNIFLLKYIPCFYYLVQFKKNLVKFQTLLNFSNKVNAIIPAYAVKLSLKILLMNIKDPKINSSTLKIFEMV